MAGLSDVFSKITDWLKDLIALGLAFALVLLVVELLFGDTIDYSIVQNVEDLVEKFTGAGIVGLIAFIFFVAIFSS